ncbi:phosphohydrolase [Kistimonas asteriae]|uniref:phosphohydrolase n=1 Tax=Kistimonas asteriae TaxID=517724 RepID=UPI001BA7A100|nr:phosphohydrolase [Kistimonas asteriae]
MAVFSDDEQLALWESRFVDYLRHHETDDHSHDLSHFQRVWKTAQLIMAEDDRPINRLVVLAACYFHDIVSLPKDHPQRSESSRLAAAKTREILQELAFSESLIPAVAHAVEAHSFSANIPTETPEAEVVQDADRMESLGAIGLARVFYTSGKLGRHIFNPEDPWASNRELDDRNFGIDHFPLKLLRLADTMKTEAGRKLARHNTEYLNQFLQKLARELEGDYSC